METKNNKLFDFVSGEYVDATGPVKSFLDGLEALSKEFGISLTHEDEQGAFILTDYDEKYNITPMLKINKANDRYFAELTFKDIYYGVVKAIEDLLPNSDFDAMSITLNTKLEEDLGMDLGFDELEIHELIEKIESRFNVEVSNEDMKKINTFGDIIDIVYCSIKDKR